MPSEPTTKLFRYWPLADIPCVRRRKSPPHARLTMRRLRAQPTTQPTTKTIVRRQSPRVGGGNRTGVYGFAGRSPFYGSGTHAKTIRNTASAHLTLTVLKSGEQVGEKAPPHDRTGAFFVPWTRIAANAREESPQRKSCFAMPILSPANRGS